MYEIQPGKHPVSQGAPSRHGPKIVALVFCVLGVVFSMVGFLILWLEWRAERWPKAPGRILSSKVETRRGSKGSTTRACRVEYVFTVDGRQHHGDKLHPALVWTSGNGPLEEQARYPAGSECQVHFNPDKPSESCLDPELGAFPWIFAIIGMAIGGVGGVIAAVLWWKRH